MYAINYEKLCVLLSNRLASALGISENFYFINLLIMHLLWLCFQSFDLRLPNPITYYHFSWFLAFSLLVFYMSTTIILVPKIIYLSGYKNIFAKEDLLSKVSFIVSWQLFI